MSLADLSRGELVTRAARRKANGALDLGAARGMKSSLLSTSGSWNQLPEPLLVRDLAAYGERLRALPPRCLRPRGLGDGIAVVQLGVPREVAVTGDGQAVAARVVDVAGNAFEIHTHYRQVSPGAVDATAAALRSGATFVAGELRKSKGAWSMEPLALLTPQLLVVDLHPQGQQGPESWWSEGEAQVSSLAAERLAGGIEEYVGRTLLKGARETQAAGARLAGEAESLAAHELSRLCARASRGILSALVDLAILIQIEQP